MAPVALTEWAAGAPRHGLYQLTHCIGVSREEALKRLTPLTLLSGDETTKKGYEPMGTNTLQQLDAAAVLLQQQTRNHEQYICALLVDT